MSAITGTAITNIPLTRNTAADTSAAVMTPLTNAGTLITDTETVEIIAPKGDHQILIQMNNGCGATVTANILSGDMWASTGDSANISIPTGKTFSLTIDSAKYKTKDGKIKIKFTPTAGTALNAASKVNVSALLLN